MRPATHRVQRALQGRRDRKGHKGQQVPRAFKAFQESRGPEGHQGHSHSSKGTGELQGRGLQGGDGTYWIDPDGSGGSAPFEAWCDMTAEGGGWTRVFSVSAPGTDCVLDTGYMADPRVRSHFAKLSDAVINQLASERIFYTQFEGMPKLFTKYTGVLSSQANAVSTIGQVVNKESYAAVQAATATYTPAYSGFILFSQHNWYQTDTQLGSRASSCRFSLEYLNTPSGFRDKYACCAADCRAASSSGVMNTYSGWMTAYVK